MNQKRELSSRVRNDHHGYYPLVRYARSSAALRSSLRSHTLDVELYALIDKDDVADRPFRQYVGNNLFDTIFGGYSLAHKCFFLRQPISLFFSTLVSATACV